MRARAIVLFFLLIGSLTVPLLPTSTASIEDLGSAGEVAELEHTAIGWWTLDNGNILIASSAGLVSVYSVMNNGSYGEVWNVDLNTTLYGADYNPDEQLVVVGTSSGAIVVSIDYMDELYRFSAGQPVDALAWDRDGDIWVTLRTSKYAMEWDGNLNTPSGVSTTPHTNGITSIITLSDGHILTSGRDKQIRIHDENGSLIQVLVDSTAPLLKLSSSEDESLLFSLTDNCKLDIHNTSSWVREHSLNLCSNGQGRSIHQMGDRLMIGMTNGKSFSVDLSTFSKKQDFSLQGEVVGFRSAEGEGVFVLTSFSSTSEVNLLDTDRDDDDVVDGLDTFPDDPTEWEDSDGDGVGDNSDWKPFDATETMDRDGDGVGDNSDLFPDNPSQQTDSDGDGYGDNKYGTNGDLFPEDSTQWADTDGDGYGDSQEPGATTPDACINQPGSSTEDRIGCQDTDGDGWSDPGNGNEASPDGTADAFYMEPNQYSDIDGDGYGDNPNGYRGDACVNHAGTSTRAQYYNTSLEMYVSISRYGCTDADGDGYDDSTESHRGTDCTMKENSSEWLDNDLDCVGSNSDYNDSDPEVQTLEHHCVKHTNDTDSCSQLGDANDNSGTSSDGIETEGKRQDTMEVVKEFAIIAGIIVGIMGISIGIIVGTLQLIGKSRDKRKPDAQYTHQDATRELDAWESGDDFETRGGIDEQKAWGDDHIDDESGDLSDMDDGLFEEESSSLESTSEIDSDVEEIVSEPVETVNEKSAEPATQEPPAEAPPLPSGGLPEGWTMEQWRWYGHQWLEKHDGN
jgi:hypothetical protein